MNFNLISDFSPSGDQSEAITQLVAGIVEKEPHQVLLGVTGSGKTFTMANVIQQTQRPTLILSHNKTLVAQLYGEFKQFFPENAVEYFVSYYDYYQPEAYVVVTDTYIEKDLSVNEEIEKLRLKTTSSLLSGRRDIIVIASVSCIYGLGNPAEYKDSIMRITAGQNMGRNSFLHSLVRGLYSRTTIEFKRGTFRVQGDTVDIFLPYADHAIRVIFFGNIIEELEIIEPETGKRIQKVTDAAIFPANIYVSPKDKMQEIFNEIQDEMKAQVEYFNSVGKYLEAKRLQERTEFDLEMIREMGYCSGIENYSRFLDRRKPGDRPFCLIDYFPDDLLMFIDESHVSVPQIGAMYGGDRSRKMALVDYGFRLPSALDNRPLNFHEFESLIKQSIYVSATPGDYELGKSGGVIIEQIVRPTGLLDPPIEIRPSINQVDDLIGEINGRTENDERILVTTLTKRMAEELSKYLSRLHIKCAYIHAEVDTMQRVEILRDLRLGVYDVLIGVNLLREGLDLPEVSLVAIMDADKEGFLRNDKSLIQTAGRAARNVNGKVIMYADRITGSMQRTMEDNLRKRAKQIAYNELHGITPQTILKSKDQVLKQSAVLEFHQGENTEKVYVGYEEVSIAADPILQVMNKSQLEKAINDTKRNMQKAAKDLDFIAAAGYRDEMYALQAQYDEKFSPKSK